MKLPSILHFNNVEPGRHRFRTKNNNNKSSNNIINNNNNNNNDDDSQLQVQSNNVNNNNNNNNNHINNNETFTGRKTSSTMYSSSIPQKYLPLYFEDEKSTLFIEASSKQTGSGSSSDDDDDNKEVLLYLIRHGEADHNVKEKIAMREAKRTSIANHGLSEDHPDTLKRMDEARKTVLNDETLRDARLSPLGRKEAEIARDNLKLMIEEENERNDHLSLPLRTPNYVLVSPLTRTLETADIIFPGHQEIHVREDLVERRTGKPPDTRSPTSDLALRKSFLHFSMNHLRKQSREELETLLYDYENAHKVEQIENDTKEKTSQEFFVMKSDMWDNFENHNFQFTEEDKMELRKRTERLFVLLGETESIQNQNAVAVVTHKGYLRELERGPFQQQNATEFRNCEIRVYQVTVSMKKRSLIKAERLR